MEIVESRQQLKPDALEVLLHRRLDIQQTLGHRRNTRGTEETPGIQRCVYDTHSSTQHAWQHTAHMVAHMAAHTSNN